MEFDSLGLPKDNGATDWADSARLAGLMAAFDHPMAPPLAHYFIKTESGLKPVRHPTKKVYPENEPRTMSRDQLTCLAAGLYFQNQEYESEEYESEPRLRGFYSSLAQLIVDQTGWFAPNDLDDEALRKTGEKKWKIPDFISPPVRDHYKRCANPAFKITKLEDWLLRRDIDFNARNPLAEHNQILAMCRVAGNQYVKYYTEKNPIWKTTIYNYWALSYRKEKDFADHMIAFTEKIIQG